MPNVRGRALVVRAEFVAQRYGDGAWQRVLDSLSPAAREALSDIEPTSWYPMEIYRDLQTNVPRILGGDANQLLEEMGAFSAERNAEHLFGKFAGDAFEFFKHIAKLHREMFDFGDMTVVRRPGGCLIEADYSGVASEFVCRSAAGFYRRCAELNGARNVQVELAECQARGDRSCLFKLTWKRIRRTTIGPKTST